MCADEKTIIIMIRGLGNFEKREIAQEEVKRSSSIFFCKRDKLWSLNILINECDRFGNEITILMIVINQMVFSSFKRTE